jgi:hypothetical protein
MPRTGRYDLPTIGAGTQELARMLREYGVGRINVSGEVTLANGSTSTLIEDANFGATTEIVLIPRADPDASFRFWLAARSRGSLTVGHTDPGTDLVCGWIAVG